MLSGILKSKVAVQVSIKIMDAFVEMRKFININKGLYERIINIENKMDSKFTENDKKFEMIFDQLQFEENVKQRIFFEGQIYDAYSIVVDNKEMYHLGASIKDLGKKCFGINKIEDTEIIKNLLNFNI